MVRAYKEMRPRLGPRAWGGALRLRSGTAACDVGTRLGVIGGLATFPGTQVNIRLPHAAGRQ